MTLPGWELVGLFYQIAEHFDLDCDDVRFIFERKFWRREDI